jgi:hypothetical protein
MKIRLTPDEKASLGVIIFILIIIGSGMLGYVFNLIKLTQCDFETPYKVEILRGIGVVVPPIGAIEGFIYMSDVGTEKKVKY